MDPLAYGKPTSGQGLSLVVASPRQQNLGDDDEVILEHAIALYRALPDLLVEKPRLRNAIVIDSLTNDPVPTFAPSRRASA